VWAYDFVVVRTRDGRAVRPLTVIDEYTRECLAIRADRHIRSSDVIETLTELMVVRGARSHSFRQRSGVYRQRYQGVVRKCRS
jgi:transposase InsO family protein